MGKSSRRPDKGQGRPKALPRRPPAPPPGAYPRIACEGGLDQLGTGFVKFGWAEGRCLRFSSLEAARGFARDLIDKCATASDGDGITLDMGGGEPQAVPVGYARESAQHLQGVVSAVQDAETIFRRVLLSTLDGSREQVQARAMAAANESLKRSQAKLRGG